LGGLPIAAAITLESHNLFIFSGRLPPQARVASRPWNPIPRVKIAKEVDDGSWSTMPEKRRAAFVDSLPPNFYEWDAVMEEETTVEEWKGLNAKTLVVSDAATRLPIREIVDTFAKACPDWTFHTISEGGHMAPLTRPELINPVVREFLDAGSV
jgi:pimeloyl-ACP methyl ester carboxylesterase